MANTPIIPAARHRVGFDVGPRSSWTRRNGGSGRGAKASRLWVALLLWIAAGGWVACGSQEAPVEEDPSADPEAGVPATEDVDWWEPNGEPAQQLVLLAVDGLRSFPDTMGNYPHLDRLLREGRSFPYHVVDSMGSQAQMASLLSGWPALHHGVGSVHERARSMISEGLPWWPEALKARGWRTFASMATPQFGPYVGGMQRGFDVFLEPELIPKAFRTIEQVTMIGREAWLGLLANPDPFVAVWHFADLQNPGRVPSPNVLREAEVSLRSWVETYPNLAQAAHEVGRNAQNFEEVRRGLGRMRGSQVLESFHEAVYRGQLADLDAALGALFDDLQRSGRFDSTLIGLVSLRGSYVGATPTGGAALAPEIARSPAILWAPGRVRPGRHGGLVPTHELARRIAWALGLATPEEASMAPKDHGACTVWAADFARRASFGKHLHMEENAAAGWVTIDREGRAIMQESALAPEAQEDARRVRAHAEASSVSWGLQLDFDLPAGESVALRWRLLEGRTRQVLPLGEGAVEDLWVRRQSGRATLRGRGSLRWETTRREVPMVLAWEAPEPLYAQSEGPRAWILPSSAKSDEAQSEGVGSQSDPSQARVLRDSGIWTRLLIAGEPDRPVEVLTGLVRTDGTTTPSESTLEITTDANHEVAAIPGRQDGLRLVASTPLNTQFKESPPYQLAMAVHWNGRWLLPIDFGQPQSGTPQAELYLPDWWPGMTETLEDGWTLRPGMVLRRTQMGPGERRALSAEAREYVQHMGKGE